MKILITGGAGFIASHLAEVELAAGNQVVALDITSDAKIRHLLHHPAFTYWPGSMLDRELVATLVRQIDLIYHFGAIADVELYCKDPIKVLDVNIEGTRLVCEFAHKYEKKLIFASTSEVYGKNPKVPWSEHDDGVLGTGQRWCYSYTKATGEQYCLGYAKIGLRMAICRFFNFYGPRIDELGRGRVITHFLDQFLRGQPVTVIKPGTQTRCFTYISDGVAGIMKIAHTPEGEGQIFNVGTERETSVLELAYLMKAIGDFHSPITLVSAESVFGRGYDDIPRRVPNTAMLCSLGWEPKVSLEEGLRITIDYFRQHFSRR
jgi:nucleoside-diphosphate-sugar epimerase